jgi:hypothetical protein
VKTEIPVYNFHNYTTSGLHNVFFLVKLIVHL